MIDEVLVNFLLQCTTSWMAHRRRAEDADLEEDASSPYYLEETASLLETKLAEFTRSGAQREPPESLKRILDLASHLFQTGFLVCSHSCEHHEKLMDPSLWGKLPTKLLFQIFVKLPLPKLMSLQLLSRRWKAAFFDEDSNSEFLTACEELHPVFALLTHAKSNKFVVRLLDVKLNTWHRYELKAGDARAVEVTAASEDGGLVCFVSSLKKNKTRTFLVDVVNPLTKRACALPPLQDFLLVEMAQIAVHPETKQYMVLVVGEAASGTKLTKLYDQKISVEKWVVPTKQRVTYYGYRFHLGNFRYSQRRDCPSVYDFAGRLLHDLRARRNPLENESVKNLALAGDRIFVLYKDRKGPDDENRWNRPALFHIVEYRLAFGTKEEWVKVKSIRCEPFEVPPRAKYELSLFACKGFLMVMAVLPEKEPLRSEVGWVYDLATCHWSDLPTLPGEIPFHVDDLMCRMHWNISV